MRNILLSGVLSLSLFFSGCGDNKVRSDFATEDQFASYCVEKDYHLLGCREYRFLFVSLAIFKDKCDNFRYLCDDYFYSSEYKEDYDFYRDLCSRNSNLKECKLYKRIVHGF